MAEEFHNATTINGRGIIAKKVTVRGASAKAVVAEVKKFAENK